MRPPAPPIDLTSETTHVGGSFEHIGNKKIQTCYSVTPDFFHGISVNENWKLKILVLPDVDFTKIAKSSLI